MLVGARGTPTAQATLDVHTREQAGVPVLPGAPAREKGTAVLSTAVPALLPVGPLMLR